MFAYGTRTDVPAWLAIVHVASHSRQRQRLMTVTTLASVSNFVPWQCGHTIGRGTI
jgi:hypothetical protein